MERSVWQFGEGSYAGSLGLAGGFQLAVAVYILYNDDNAAPFLASNTISLTLQGFPLLLPIW